MKLVRMGLITLVVGFAISLTAAQTGGLFIEVVDDTGPLPGATVTISHETGFVKTTSVLTNKQGVAEFPVLRAGGGYTVEVSFPGFGTRRLGELRVQIGKSVTETVQLSTELREKVRVTATGDVVDLEATSNTTKFTDDFIQDLPVPGRFYQNVLTLAPGVQDADGDGNPNVHGGRDRDFKAQVSGVSNVDPLTGQQMSQVNPNSIEEMEVITSGAGVEFSRAQAGFANIIQKQGSNQFEGVFEFLFQSSLLDGDGAGDQSNLPTPDFETLQPAFQISGPIVKDKLWYRLSHEFIRREDPVNTGKGIVVQDTTQGVHSDQLTWQVSPRNKLALQYQSDPREVTNLGVNSVVGPESSFTLDRTTQQYSLIWTAPVSPKILIESLVSWQDLSTAQTPTQGGVGNTCFDLVTDPVFDFLKDARCTDIDNRVTTGSFPFNVADERQRLTAQVQSTIYGGRFAGMTHQFKVGFVTENERYYREQTRNPDVQVFVFQPPPDQEELDPILLVNANIGVPPTTQVRATGNVWGLWFNDTMRPRQNLTIEVGLRLDREELNSDGYTPLPLEADAAQYLGAPRLANGEIAVQIDRLAQRSFTRYENLGGFKQTLAGLLGVPLQSLPLSDIASQSTFYEKVRTSESIAIRNTNPAPRISLAWDPWSNGKTAFTMTARRQYGALLLSYPLLELESPNTNVLFNAEEQGEGNIVITGLRNNLDPAVNTSTVDRDIETPYQDEFTFSFEREVWAETLFKATYVNRRFRNQIQDTDINHAPGDYGRCIQTAENQPIPYAFANGTGMRMDAYTQEVYYDDVPGFGDGRVQNGSYYDDCVGDLTSAGVGNMGGGAMDFDKFVQRPDGIPDLYTQNPVWGTVFELGNLNRIDYEGVTLELNRRQYRSWEMQASYTWSKAMGDGEDFQQLLGDDRSNLEDQNGFQSYDQRHVVKVNATTITPWGFRFGGALGWESGLPYSIIYQELSFHAAYREFQNLGTGSNTVRQYFPTRQRNDQRNTPFWNLDLRVSKEMNLGRGMNLQLSAEVFNVFNDDTYRVYNPAFNTGSQVNGRNQGFRRFGRRWQIGMKLAF